jgi:serine/threonine protein kinase/WD40 repeat protein
MRTTTCLSPDILRALLADELLAAEESLAAGHLSDCPDCQRLAEQLADDAQAREYQAEHRRARRPAVDDAPPAALEELRERMHVLGWFASNPGGASSDGGSTFAARNGETTSGAAAATRASPEAVITCVGKFQIVQPIGAGGFGVVYLARDRVLHRQVALKLARTSVLGDPDLKSRFLREAEALARLEHPHIIRVYEAGEHEGTCYLAVGYCDGPTLEQWLRQEERPMTPRIAAQLALALAEAVEHAHRCGVLHRDIKPSNILLDHLPPGNSSTSGPLPFVPKLTDFGLAKIAEQETKTTLAGMLLGTPPYMAPEQAAGLSERISPATDVYALGAVLYETLTSQPPIQGDSPIDTLRRVLIDEPIPPQQLAPAVPEDLAAIVLKCLDKSPTRRYATAADLAADLARYLDGRPTFARPLSRTQQAARWINRNRAASIVGGLATLVLLLMGGMLFFNRQLAQLRETTARQRAEIAYRDDILAANQRYAEGDVAQTVDFLQRQQPAPGGQDFRGLEWHYLRALTTHDRFARQHPGTDVYQMCLSPDETQLAAGCADARLYLYDAKTLALQKVIETTHIDINGVCYSPAGEWLATIGDDGFVRVWDTYEHKLVKAWQAHQCRAYQAVFFDGGRKLATCGEEPVIRLWDTTTWESDGVLEGHQKVVEALAISPVEDLLASASEDHHAITWDLPTRTLVHRLNLHTGKVSCLAFSPDGRWLATGGEDCAVSLWRHAVGRRRSAGFHRDGVQSVAFTHDGRLIAGDRAGTVRTYRLGTHFPEVADEDSLKAPEDQWLAHDGKIWSIAVLPEKGRFISAGGDGQICGWRRGHDLVRRWPSDGDDFYGAGYSRNGSELFVLRAKSGVACFDAALGQARFTLHEPGLLWDSFAMLPGRDQVAAGSQSGEIVLWNWRTRNRLATWKIGGDAFQRLKYCPVTGQLAAVAHAREDVLVIDSHTGKQVASLPAPSGTDCAFSPDGQRLAVDTLNRLAIYDIATQRQIALSPGHTLTINTIAYSPSGELIATASSDRSVRLWTKDGEPVASLLGHTSDVSAVAFTPDGKSLLTGGHDGQIKVFHVATQRELLSIDSGLRVILRLVVSPTGREIAAIGGDWQLALISIPPRTEEN